MNTEQTEDHAAGLELKPRCGTFAQIMMDGQRKSVNYYNKIQCVDLLHHVAGLIALPIQTHYRISAYTLSLVPNKIKRLKCFSVCLFVCILCLALCTKQISNY